MNNKILNKMKKILSRMVAGINKKGYHTFNEILRSTLWMTGRCNATAIVLAVVLTLGFTSCESFLDTENLMEKNTGNYPQTLVDAQQTVAGIYNSLSLVNANPHRSFLFVAELASDDRLGGGGVNDRVWQAEDLLLNSEPSMLDQFWVDRYAGIRRANAAIQNLGNCTGYDSDEQKNQMIGEAYFLRAFYYYELVSLFENIPLLTEPVAENKPQASPDEVWGQIVDDLITAIGLLANKPFGYVETGHADKWAAEALIARAFLFYTGFYNKSDVQLPSGGTITKQDIIAYVDDCVNNSGYSLVADYRNLWAYTNRLTKEDYVYTKGKNLEWVEDDNKINPETLFAIKFSKFADWGTTIGYSNGFALFFGVRGGQAAANTFPFGPGWGAGPVAPNLWTDWINENPDDLRREASISNIRTELDPLGFAKGGWADWVQETDYYAKKSAPISSKRTDGSYTETFEQDMYDHTSVNFQLSNIHDLVLIRFADVLLMQSELKEDPTGINRVRQRAGLEPIPGYSLEALQKERRWELAFEGVRWNDIRRWGIAEQALDKQKGQPVYYAANPETNVSANDGGGYAVRYRETRGFFPIPERQISLSGGVYKQNEGWGTPNATYSVWK
jgi:hypothetical protein